MYFSPACQGDLGRSAEPNRTRRPFATIVFLPIREYRATLLFHLCIYLAKSRIFGYLASLLFRSAEDSARLVPTLRRNAAGMRNIHLKSIVRFGVFELDLRIGELRKQGLKIRLQEQPFSSPRGSLRSVPGK